MQATYERMRRPEPRIALSQHKSQKMKMPFFQRHRRDRILSCFVNRGRGRERERERGRDDESSLLFFPVSVWVEARTRILSFLFLNKKRSINLLNSYSKEFSHLRRVGIGRLRKWAEKIMDG